MAEILVFLYRAGGRRHGFLRGFPLELGCDECPPAVTAPEYRVLCGWLGLGMKPAGGWRLLHPAYLHTAELHTASNINVLVTSGNVW